MKLNLSLRQSNVLWLSFERGMKMLIAALATFYIARYLGVEKFGAISFLQGTVLILISVSNFGLDSVLIKELAIQPEASRSIFLKALNLKIITTLFLTLLGSIAYFYFPMTEVEKSIFLPPKNFY